MKKLTRVEERLRDICGEFYECGLDVDESSPDSLTFWQVAGPLFSYEVAGLCCDALEYKVRCIAAYKVS